MSFVKSLSIESELSEEVSKEVAKTAFILFRDVVVATPVDTGRARGNWQVSTASFKEGVTDNIDKAGGSTINKGKKIIDRVTNVKYPTVYISNNLPYIGRLNDGHSQQAPKKFVERAIKRASK